MIPEEKNRVIQPRQRNGRREANGGGRSRRVRGIGNHAGRIGPAGRGDDVADLADAVRRAGPFERAGRAPPLDTGTGNAQQGSDLGKTAGRGLTWVGIGQGGGQAGKHRQGLGRICPNRLTD